MAAIAVHSVAAVSASLARASVGGHRAGAPSPAARVAAPVMHFRGRRPCSPRPRFSPGRFRVVFSKDAFPPNPQAAYPPPPQQPQAQAEASANAEKQGQEQGQGQDQGQGQGQGAGADGWAEKRQWEQGQQQWRQQRQWGPGDAWASSCRPRTWEARGPAYVDVLSPWFPGDRSLEQMLGQVDRMLGSMVGPAWGKWGATQRQQLGGLMSLAMRRPWDVRETAEAYILSFDLPGLSKEDVSVSVDGSNKLSIKAEKKGEGSEEESSASATRMPRKFQTDLQLPEDIKKDGLSAEMKDGVLTITIPKNITEDPAAEVTNVPVV